MYGYTRIHTYIHTHTTRARAHGGCTTILLIVIIAVLYVVLHQVDLYARGVGCEVRGSVVSFASFIVLLLLLLLCLFVRLFVVVCCVCGCWVLLRCFRRAHEVIDQDRTGYRGINLLIVSKHSKRYSYRYSYSYTKVEPSPTAAPAAVAGR